MSQLKTYARNGEDLFVLPDGDEPTEPGQFVGHTAFPSSTCGTVVAIDETDVCVLWSREPYVVDVGQAFMTGGYVFAPYVPLQVSPTIFDPTAFVTGSIARYSKRAINHNFFVTGSII